MTSLSLSTFLKMSLSSQQVSTSPSSPSPSPPPPPPPPPSTPPSSAAASEAPTTSTVNVYVVPKTPQDQTASVSQFFPVNPPPPDRIEIALEMCLEPADVILMWEGKIQRTAYAAIISCTRGCLKWKVHASDDTHLEHVYDAVCNLPDQMSESYELYRQSKYKDLEEHTEYLEDTARLLRGIRDEMEWPHLMDDYEHERTPSLKHTINISVRLPSTCVLKPVAGHTQHRQSLRENLMEAELRLRRLHNAMLLHRSEHVVKHLMVNTLSECDWIRHFCLAYKRVASQWLLPPHDTGLKVHTFQRDFVVPLEKEFEDLVEDRLTKQFE